MHCPYWPLGSYTVCKIYPSTNDKLRKIGQIDDSMYIAKLKNEVKNPVFRRSYLAVILLLMMLINRSFSICNGKPGYCCCIPRRKFYLGKFLFNNTLFTSWNSKLHSITVLKLE